MTSPQMMVDSFLIRTCLNPGCWIIYQDMRASHSEYTGCKIGVPEWNIVIPLYSVYRSWSWILFAPFVPCSELYKVTVWGLGIRWFWALGRFRVMNHHLEWVEVRSNRARRDSFTVSHSQSQTQQHRNTRHCSNPLGLEETGSEMLN